MQKKLFRLAPKEVLFLECDIQDKFIKHVQLGPSVVHNARRLAQTAQIFKIPVISTQQLPKIFGPTVKEIDEIYQTSPDLVFR
jgi:nicotinamidase-related amidase